MDDERNTFSAMPLVRIEIRGRTHPRGFPYLPIDDGLVHRFLGWLLEAGVWTARGGTSGPGIYVGYFNPDDAERVRAWIAADETRPVEVPADGGWR